MWLLIDQLSYTNDYTGIAPNFEAFSKAATWERRYVCYAPMPVIPDRLGFTRKQALVQLSS